LTACITEILSEPTFTVRSSILFSFIGSLNLQLVNRCRAALRERAAGHTDESTIPTLDERNEADDAAGDNAGCFEQGPIDEVSAAYAGNPKPMNASQIAMRLGAIRSFCHQQQEAMKSNNVVPFVPRSLYDSIDWIKSQLPTNSKPTDPAILVAMKLTGRSAEQCVAVRNTGHASERAELEALADEIVSLGEGYTVNAFADAQAVEEAFDSLPAHVKVNLYISAINGCVNSYNGSFKRVLLRGDAAAAGDMTIAESLYKRGLTTLQQMCRKHAAELSDYEARGGKIKEVARIS
jgi:hypothetical protein